MESHYDCPECHSSMIFRVPNKVWARVKKMILDHKKDMFSKHIRASGYTSRIHISFDDELDLSNLQTWEIGPAADFILVNGFRSRFPTLFGIPVKYDAAETRIEVLMSTVES